MGQEESPAAHQWRSSDHCGNRCLGIPCKQRHVSHCVLKEHRDSGGAFLGAISVRLRIDDSAFVFVTSHLASGSSEGDQIKRNLDFLEIVRRTQFPHEVNLMQVKREDGSLVEDFSTRPDGIPDNAPYEVRRAFVGGKWGPVRSLRDLDNIIWVGDLNYRLMGKPKEIIQFIRADKSECITL